MLAELGKCSWFIAPSVKKVLRDAHSFESGFYTHSSQKIDSKSKYSGQAKKIFMMDTLYIIFDNKHHISTIIWGLDKMNCKPQKKIMIGRKWSADRIGHGFQTVISQLVPRSTRPYFGQLVCVDWQNLPSLLRVLVPGVINRKILYHTKTYDLSSLGQLDHN